MSIRDLQKLKKNNIEIQKTEYKRFLVVGDDKKAATRALELVKSQGLEEVGLLKKTPYVEQDLQSFGPSRERQKTGLGITPLFYKDQDFKLFYGRSKNQKLLNEEIIYTLDQGAQTRAVEAIDEELLIRLNQLVISAIPLKIEKVEPTDFIQPVEWKVLLSDGRLLTCQHLIWACHPQIFIDLFTPKNSISDEVLGLVEETHGPSAVYIRYYLNQKIDDRRETFFIPLSQTHELGHFIGQIRPVEQSAQFCFDFIYFVDLEQVDEDLLSKNIKLLRRSLEKIFGLFNQAVCGEYIKVRSPNDLLVMSANLVDKMTSHWEHFELCQAHDQQELNVNVQESFEDSSSFEQKTDETAQENENLEII